MAEPVPLRRNRDFTLLWTGHTISVLGSQITAMAYPLLVLAMTGSAASAGVVGFFAWIPYALFAVPTGWLVDRFDRRRLMLLAETGRGLAIGSLVLALALDALTLPQIMLVAFVEGSLFVLFDLAEIPAVRNVVAPGQVPAALALNEARSRGALLAARPIGGVFSTSAAWHRLSPISCRTSSRPSRSCSCAARCRPNDPCRGHAC